MKRFVLITCMLVGVLGSASAQQDDLYFVPKKKSASKQVERTASAIERSMSEEEKSVSATTASAQRLEMDEDAYNRRGSYLDGQEEEVSAYVTSDDDMVLTDADDQLVARAHVDEGWVNGFDGSV